MTEDELAAVFAVIRAQQESAEKATANMERTAAELQLLLARFKQETANATRDASQTIQKTGREAVDGIDRRATEVLEKVAATDIGTRIDAATAPVLEQLRDQYTKASQTTERLGRVSSYSRWKERGIGALAGALLALILTAAIFWPYMKRNDSFINEVHSAMYDRASETPKPVSTPHGTKPKARKGNTPATTPDLGSSQPQ